MNELIFTFASFLAAIITGLFYNRLLKKERPTTITHTSHNLPAMQFFVGRQDEVKYILDLVSPNNPSHIIGIYGIGGVGKTALALQVAKESINKNLFNNIVYFSSKQNVLTPDGVVSRQSSGSTLSEIILSIAYTLNMPDIIKAREEEKVALIRAALTRQHTLLIIDNLETANDSDKVIAFLSELPQATKIIITSRRRYSTPAITEIQLETLSSQDGYKLIELMAKTKSVNLSEFDTRKIYEYSQGLPLAIIYIISRISLGFSIENTLNQMSQPSNDFLTFTIRSVMEHINNISRQILMAIAYLPDFSSKEEIIQATGINDEKIIEESISELLRLSIIEKQANNYALRALMKQYIINNFPEFGEFSSEAKERVSIPK